MFDEQILDSYLVKLHSGNFYEVRPILDGLQGILLDESLKPEEIAYCNSRIFNSKLNLFTFIQDHITQKDPLQANMRKGLYKIISKYIKMRETLIMEYVQTIYDSCIKFFKIDDSGTAKQASLKPLIKIIQYITQKEVLKQIIDPVKLTQTLLNEIKFLTIVSSVKGTIWHLLGVISKFFDEDLTEDIKTEIQQICLLQLNRQMNSQKPETNLIVGAFKSFRFSLSQIYLKVNEIQQLYSIMIAGITEIKDLKVYKVINAALRLLEEQTQAFSTQILEKPQQIFDKTLLLINHKNKQVKENASSALESFMNQISKALDQDMGSHQQTFKYIMKKMFELIKDQEGNTEFHSVTVIIRAVGIFSQAIVKIMGEEQLHIFFEKLIRISEKKLLRVFEMTDNQYRNEFSSADDIYHGGQGFKVVLYRQKQLTGFLQSFAHIIRNLSTITDKEAQHIFQLSIVAVKQHQVMYIKYKQTLYNSFVSLLMALKMHQKIYLLWVKKFVADGLIESLKMPDLLHVSLEDYYDSLKSTATLWENIFIREDQWTENTLQTFTDCFFSHFNELLQKSDLSYTVIYEDKENPEENQEIQSSNDDFFTQINTQKLNQNLMEIEDQQQQDEQQETEEQKQQKIQELMKETQTIQYIPNNINEMQYFYRIVLLLDHLIPKLRQNTIQQWIPILYRNSIAKLRQLPRSLFLLKLLKCLNNFMNQANIMRHLRSKEKNELVILMKNFFEDLFEQQRKYQDELLQDSLKVLLTVPYEIIIAENYKFFKNQMMIVFKRSFDLGEHHISLGFCAIESLDRIVKRGKSKIVQKYLSIIIPSLSDYLMLEQKKIDNPQQKTEEKHTINTEKAEMFNETLQELQIGRGTLVRKVQNFLGSIGGLSHLIVPNENNSSNIQISQTLLKELEAFQKKQKSLIAWDYEAKITFPLPLAAKKVDLNMTKFLPRILEIALNHAEDRMKVFSCELVHALVIYMIGKTAQKEPFQKKKNKQNNNYAKLYSKIFPILFKIASDTSHPSSKLLSQLSLQSIRWFAHSKNPESPEVLELLETLTEAISSKDNNNLREFASRGLGELVKWSIKTKSRAELEIQHGNIKATFRKLQSLASHPDSYKRFGALLGLKENLKNIQNEPFLVDKYILEIGDTSLQIAKTAGITSDMREIIYFLVDRISKIIIRNVQTLKKPKTNNNNNSNSNSNKKRSGNCQNLEEFLDYIYQSSLFAKEQEVRKCSFIYLYNILQKCRKILGYDIHEYLTKIKAGKDTLFQPHQIQQLQLQNFLKDIEQSSTVFITQCEIFQNLLQPINLYKQHNLHENFLQNSIEPILQTDDLVNDYNDFSVVFVHNLKVFLHYLQKSLQDKDQTSESLIDIIYSNKHIKSLTGQQCQDTQSWLVFQALKQLITLLNMFDEEILEYIYDQIGLKDKEYSLFLQFSLKPAQFLYSINLQSLLHDEQYYKQLSIFFKNTEKIFNSQKNQQENSDLFHQNIILSALENATEINQFQQEQEQEIKLQHLLLDVDLIKDHEVKVFVKGLSVLFSQLIHTSPACLSMIEETVQYLFQWIQQYEEERFILKKKDSNQNFLEHHNPHNNNNYQEKLQSYERVSLLLEFALDQSTENTDRFVLLVLHEQSVIFQKYEDLLLKYLNKRWKVICREFFKNSTKNLSLFKLIIPIIQQFFIEKKWENLQVMFEQIPILEKQLDRNSQAFLILEIKINSLILSQVNFVKFAEKSPQKSQNYLKYAQNLLKIALNELQGITIHQESLHLFGLYLRALKKQKINIANTYTTTFKAPLETLRSKYFPIRLSSLTPNSKEEIAFKTIFESLKKMVQISSEIQILELFFPILREKSSEKLQIQLFIKQFLRENFLQKSDVYQGECISFIIKHFMDERLDTAVEENVRFALVRNILVYMLENANTQVLIDFMAGMNEGKGNRFFEYFLDQKGIKEPKTNLNKLLAVQQLECFMIILNSVYKKLPLEKIKTDLHQGMYGLESKGNELNKKIIVECDKILKNGLQEHEVIVQEQLSGKDVELIGMNIKEIFRSLYCQTFNLLANTLMKTQTKQKLFIQYLFLKKDRKLWQLLLDPSQTDFNFTVETNFPTKILQKFENLQQNQQQKNTQNTVQQLQNRYFKETMLYTESQVQQKGQFLLENKAIQQQNLETIQEEEQEEYDENTQYEQENQDNYSVEIELDIINRHECMPTLLHLMDFMVEKFSLKDNEWTRHLLEVLQKEQETSLAERIFLLKLVLNRQEYFAQDAQFWFPILLQYANLPQNGGKGFHYYLRDVVTVAMDWMSSSPHIINKGEGLSELKQSYCTFINNLIPKLANTEKQMFRQNHTILFNLLKFFGGETVYLDEKKLLKMLKINDQKEPDKAKKEELQLWKINAIKILSSALQLKIPILQNYQEFIQNKHNNPQKFRFWSQLNQNEAYKHIAYCIIYLKKDFSKDSASLYGHLFSFLSEYGLFQPQRLQLEETVIVDLLSMLQSKEKTIKERFSSILNCISSNYPQILDTKKLFLNCLDLISKQTKKERAQAFRCLCIYIQKNQETGQLKKIENQIKQIAMSIQADLEKILVDSDTYNQREFLDLLLILSQQSILSIPEVLRLYVHKFQQIQKQYQKNSTQSFAENYYSILLSLDDYLNELQEAEKSKEIKDFQNQIKAALLTGLSSQHRPIRKKIFQFLDSQTQNSESPLDKLLYLIKDIYQPEEEELWLISAVPLLLSLSKKSSDYSRELYDEPLDNLAQFYDWDFRDPSFQKKFNTSQPLTPIFTLATQMSQGFMVPRSKAKNPYSQLSQLKMPQGFIRNSQDLSQQSQLNNLILTQQQQQSQNQSNSQIRSQQQSTFSASLVEPSSQQRRFDKLQRQTQNSQLSIFERAEQNFKNQMQKLQLNSQKADDSSQNPELLHQKNKQEREENMDSRKVNQNMSQFFSKNMMDFETVKLQNNKIRYTTQNKQGQTLTTEQDIQKRQFQIFLERQERAKQKQIQLTRKYRVGELPDIKIMYKDVIDPLIELAFYDEDISGDLFTMLFLQLFKIEENELRKKELTYILSNLSKKSTKFNFNFISTIQKTMLELTKLGQLFPSDIIAQSGLKSHAYHTSALLLEESVFTKKYRQNLITSTENSTKNKSKTLKFKRKPRNQHQKPQQQQQEEQEENDQEFFKIESSEQMAYWMDLIDVYSHLCEHDQVKGVLSNVLQQQASEETIEALDLKMSGQIKIASEELSQILEALKDQQIQQQQEEIDVSSEELILQQRIRDYLQGEKQECLQMLNQWENLTQELVVQHSDSLHNPQQLGIQNMRQIFNSLLHQENQWEVLKDIGFQWEQSPQGRQILEGPLAYEMSLLLITQKDIDRARYYHKLSSEQFLKIWPNYGSFASASKHEFLQNLQKNYELKEFMDLDRNINITVNDCSSLFKNWCNRLPSYSHDSLMCWDQILSGRELYSLTLVDRFRLDERIVNKNRSIWYVQHAKGMVKKGIFGAADPKMKEARKLRIQGDSSHFNWEFYKNTAKLKLKQLEINLQNVKVSEEEDPVEPFRKLNAIFEKESINNRQIINEVTKYKFHFLQLHVLEKFIEVYNDKILTNMAGDKQYENYAYVLDEVFDGYNQILENENFNRKIDIMNTLSQNPSQTALLDYQISANEELLMLKKKEYFRFAQFSEKFIRILEGESVRDLRNILLKDYEIDIELVSEQFVNYTLKTFELIGGIKEVELKNEIESVSQSFNEELSQNQREKLKKNVNANTEIDKRLAGLIIKMIQVVQRFSDKLGPIFRKAIEKKTIPIWAFLTFLPQLMNILNNDNLCQYFDILFYELAEKYSEAFIYQFNIIFPERSVCLTQCSQDLYDRIHDEFSHYFTFISALNSLTHPEHRLIHQLQQLKDLLCYISHQKDKSQQQQDNIDLQCERIFEDVLLDPENSLGKYNAKFLKDHKAKFEKLAYLSQKFTKISEKEQHKFIEKIDQYLQKLKENQNDIPSGFLKLSDFSAYLDTFQSSHPIEIPGQYGQTSNSSMNGGGLQEPQLEQHVLISSFDKQLLCLKSIRRPKRLIVYGTDEKSYMFLVKGIEDLRLDQRIEQLYSVMNNIFDTDSESKKRQLYLSTFLIIPMTKSLGILEWVNETKVLGEILEKELQEQNGYLESLKENDAYNTRYLYLQKQRGEGISRKHLPLMNKQSQEIEQEFNYQQDLLPPDLLRNALQRLSMNSEAYLYLKNRFIRNYAVLCIAGYLLGIGDRHLENFLINYKTGEVVSIDFGISFGEGLNLFIPELMPFRLTRCFESLMSPVGVNGLFRHSMITSLSIMKKKRHLLLDFCEVFISDPLLDWLKLSKDKRFNQSFLSQNNMSSVAKDSVQISQYEDQLSSQWSAISKGENVQIEEIQKPEGKINIVKYKLLGLKSYKIMIDELKSSRHKNQPYMKNLEKILQGKEGSFRHSIRGENFLSVVKQVDCLIEHASDPNVLGRTWIGWLPFV